MLYKLGHCFKSAGSAGAEPYHCLPRPSPAPRQGGPAWEHHPQEPPAPPRPRGTEWPQHPMCPALWESINQFAANVLSPAHLSSCWGSTRPKQTQPSTPRTGSMSKAAVPALGLPGPPAPTAELSPGKQEALQGKPGQHCSTGGMPPRQERELPWPKAGDLGDLRHPA